MVNHGVIVLGPFVRGTDLRLCVFCLVVGFFFFFFFFLNFVRLFCPCCLQGFYSETHSCDDAQESQEDEVEEAAEEERCVRVKFEQFHDIFA